MAAQYSKHHDSILSKKKREMCKNMEQKSFWKCNKEPVLPLKDVGKGNYLASYIAHETTLRFYF